MSNSYNVGKVLQGSEGCHQSGIDKLGINSTPTVYLNLQYEKLQEHEKENNEATVAKAKYGETMTVDTGKYTGRSPKDRFIVNNPGSESSKNIDWNDINKPIAPDVFDELYKQAVDYFNGIDHVYVFEGYCGADPDTRKKVRFLFEKAWQQHFVTNMFIRPSDPHELENFEPDFTIINVSSQVVKDWKRLGLHSETAIVFNVEKKLAVIYGTWYGGENKKGIFSLMNYWLPMQGHLSMHCSSNVGKDGDTALFFGLSGTGKTTLSADPNRALIGDDEHGWDNNGIFNLEGGCYAKTIDLCEENEPDIYRAIRPKALLENVKILTDGTPDYSDTTKTENGRVSYPISFIPNHLKKQMAGHPKNIIFLSCDAFGVLPPVAKLTSGQAMYHFMSGYTAKVAGTEAGITEPQAAFSACFGGAFMTLHPTRYADLLKKKLDLHGSHVFLVNSGWSAGPYGVGSRMSIKTTRACVTAILNGSINDVEFVTDPLFGFAVPKSLPGIDDPTILNPKTTWSDPAAYDKMALHLAELYKKNFAKYQGKGDHDYSKFGPI